MSSVVGAKGQITIEQPIREALGIGPGWRAVQRVEDGKVIIEFLPPRHSRSLAGALKDATSVRVPTEEALQEAIESAWAGTVNEESRRYEGGDPDPTS